jgi:hypothetical protein
VDGGVLWRNGCDGKALRCGAGNRHKQMRAITCTVQYYCIAVVYFSFPAVEAAYIIIVGLFRRGGNE